MWRALLGLAALAGAKQDALQVFLGELQRKLSDEVSEAQHWQQQRHEWCQSTLSLLAQEGQRGEGVVEELRQSLAKWDAAPREDGRSSFVQLRQATELQELQERLRLRGASSSAQHRFTEALRRDCAAAFEQSEVRHKAVEEELELLQSSAEALQASEALHGIDQSPLVKVSFLQVGSNQDRGKAELPDFLSLFRAPEEAPEEGSPEAARSEPEATEDERPKVLDLMAKLHKEHMARSSQDASWCKEELQRQRRALEAAQGAQRSFAAEAEEQRRRQAALDAELVQLQHADGVAQQALERLQHDVANSTQVLLVLQKDRRLAAQVLKKALAEQRLEGPRPRSDPAETAVRYLTAAAQSFEQAAVAPPAPGDAETSSPPVTLRGAELRRALQAERQALQLQRDRRQRALRRAEELSNLSAAQATSLEQELRGLDGCGSSSSEWKAEVRALQDAERVFAGEPISVPRPRRAIRGAAPLSRMEAAAEALGVSIS
ncbi:unnamed protein product [Durusdinium trenchii]|uniref:Uncharacterized protein n=1 Tax=Durusdinium trenchii TaxID=1381693 RepID=A0ABP0RJT3_9DINO